MKLCKFKVQSANHDKKGPQTHNSSFYMQCLSNFFFFGCSSHRTDLDWLWSEQSSCQGTCLGVRGGKDPCQIGITGAGTLVGRWLGWPRIMCESCRVISERMAGAQSLSVRIQLQPTETTLAGFSLE